MKDYISRKWEIPTFEKNYEIIVAGGGTAGAVAGIAAARSGASTLIVESNSFLGGSAAGGQVVPMMSTKIPGNPVNSSISQEIKKKMGETGQAGGSNYNWFNPVRLKMVLENMYKETGADVLYDTRVVEVVKAEDTITGLIVHTRSGLKMIKGEVFIDSTGDAVIAERAGAPCREGPEVSDYEKQSVSLRFMMGNIDLNKFKNFLKELGQEGVGNSDLLHTAMVWNEGWVLESVFKKAVEKGILKYEDGNYFQAFSVPGMPGVLSFNCPEIPDSVSPFQQQQISQAYIKGREMMQRYTEFFKEYFPGFKNSFIIGIASMLGLRETRRIEGEYLLNLKDYNQQRHFEDAVARTAYPLDIHGMDESELNIEDYEKGDFMEIPFRSLIPKKVSNLLTAGRSISSTFAVQSVIRIQPTCRATGEAAALGAIQALNNKIKIKDIEGSKIRTRMKARGCDL